MKIIKISLVVIVLAILLFFAIKSIISVDPPAVVAPDTQTNTFVKKIKDNIIMLGKLPDNKFCLDTFNTIEFLIDDSYKSHPPQYPYGRLGSTKLENDQQKDNLSKELNAVYSDKFIEQTGYVIKNSAWPVADLNFIRSECKRLRSSPLLQRGGPLDNKFIEIQNALSKYDEIVNFISTCNNYQFNNLSLSAQFPIADVEAKISRTALYRNNKLENFFVNNCSRLHDELNGVSQTLFLAHVRYLDNKIQNWTGKYSDPAFGFRTHKDYVNTLYTPLKIEIDGLKNVVYNVSNRDSEFNRLSKKWSDDNANAYKHFN